MVNGGQVIVAEVGHLDVPSFGEQEGTEALQVVVMGVKEPVAEVGGEGGEGGGRGCITCAAYLGHVEV